MGQDELVINKIKNEVTKLRSEGYENICIIHPQLNIGGGGIFYVNLGKWLSEYTDLNIYFYDYKSGYLSFYAKNSNIKCIEYTEKGEEFVLRNKCIILTTVTRVVMLPKMNPQNKIIFWNYESCKLGWNSLFVDGHINSFFNLIKKKNALCYHDWSSRESINYYDKTFFNNDDFLHVVLPPKNAIASSSLITDGIINISCLQRIAIEKVQSAKVLIKALADVASSDTFSFRIRLHIIGDGPKRNELVEYAEQFASLSPKFEVVFLGAIPHDLLDEYLLNNIDLAFGMGTAALETAALGIPTALFLLSYDPIDSDKVFFLFDSHHKTLGIHVDLSSSFKTNYVSIKDVVYQCIEKKAELGKKCLNYYLKEHSSIDDLGLFFLNFANRSSLFFSQLKKCIKYTPLNQLKTKKIKLNGITIFSKLTFTNTVKYKFFNITFLKKQILDGTNHYKLCNLFDFSIRDRKVWNFPSSKRNEMEVVKKGFYLNEKQQIKQKFKNGNKLKICLIVCRPSAYPFGDLFGLLNNDPRFEPIVVIMPDKMLSSDKDNMIAAMNKTAEELSEIGILPIKGYDIDVNSCVDIRKEINPDIVFYSDFGYFHFFDKFYFFNFLDKFTFLTEYGFSCMEDKLTVCYNLSNSVDCYFRYTSKHIQMAQKYMKNKGKNVVLSGSPKLDVLFDKNHIFNDIWPVKQNSSIKRIIWAPHHGAKNPSTMYVLDSFYVLSNFMLELAKKYQDSIQIVFRPHPLLKKELCEIWGENKTNEYYEQWDKLKNTMYFLGDYNDMFYYSDAMIMDSCSFMAEYTAYNKPIFYTASLNVIENHLNEFGKDLIKFFYTAQNADSLLSDVRSFIDQVVINGDDLFKEQRAFFVKENFSLVNNQLASKNMYDQIIKMLEN